MNTINISRPSTIRVSNIHQPKNEDYSKDNTTSLQSSGCKSTLSRRTQHSFEPVTCASFKKILVDFLERFLELDSLFKDPKTPLSKLRAQYQMLMEKRLKNLLESQVYEQIKNSNEQDRLQQLINSAVLSDAKVERNKDHLINNL